MKILLNILDKSYQRDKFTKLKDKSISISSENSSVSLILQGFENISKKQSRNDLVDFVKFLNNIEQSWPKRRGLKIKSREWKGIVCS